MNKRISLRKNAVSNSEKIKRQRFATEQILAFAKRNGIEVNDGAIAEAKRVKMTLDVHNDASMLLYVIVSKDGSKLLCWDMIQSESPDSSKVIVRSHYKPFVIPADNKTEDIRVKRCLDRGLDPVMQMDYLFRMQSYYVLETLPMFEEQKKITERLERFASRKELYLFDGVRAKIATYSGKPVWSLRCSRDKKGQEVVYVIYHDGEVDIVSSCRAWVLQQRVAVRDMRRYLIEKMGNDGKVRKRIAALDINPLLAQCYGQECWAWYFSDSNTFIVCPLNGDKLYEAPYGEVLFMINKEQQKKHASIDFVAEGIRFKATCWYEFIYTEAVEKD